jgi:hypothetical protein
MGDMPQAESSEDPKRIIVDLTMSLADARQVEWQGSGPREPIGELLDSGRITYRDLAWAVKSASNPQMRAAAQTLLAHWLGQPTTLEGVRRYGPEVVSGSRYLEDTALRSVVRASFREGLVLAGLLVASVLAVLLLVAAPDRGVSWLAALLIVVLAGLIWALLNDAGQKFRQFANFQKGRQGEDAVVERLRTTLDNRWTIFRNVVLPDRRGDIDVVLVGPGGVFALEVKAYSGAIRLRRGQWERRVKGSWTRMPNDPCRQARQNARRLIDFARQHGVSLLWAEPIVVMTGPHAASDFDVWDVAVWLLPTMSTRIEMLRAHMPISESEIGRITTALKKLAASQLADERAGQFDYDLRG